MQNKASQKEQELIEATKKDKSNFVQLYDMYFDKIYGYILTKVADRELAEDITSETFYKALEKIDSFEWKGFPFSSWLFKIAINEMNMYFRKNKKQKKIMEKEWLETENRFTEANKELKEKEEQMEQKKFLQEIHRGMQTLNEKEQHILSLKYFEDLSYEEIGEILNINKSNVGARLSRSLKKLSKVCQFT